MAKARAISSYLSELIQTYQAVTQKSCTEMALDFEITLSNLYLYRNGRGNPRARTVDKIVSSVERNCPLAFQSVALTRPGPPEE